MSKRFHNIVIVILCVVILLLSMDRTVQPPFVGSEHSVVYHNRVCGYVDRILRSNLVGFISPAHATAVGYRICLVCAKKLKEE